MALELDFVISDESVNRYGFRILTSGIDLTAFERNPVCCVGHNTEGLSIGKWKNLRKEPDGRLIGTLEFDEEDPEAKKIYNKYKNGYMKAVSLNVLKKVESSDPAHILPGQPYPTITESEMLEISAVTLPGNGNAIKLFNAEGKEVQLSIINKPLNQNDMPKPEELQKELEELKKKSAATLVKLHFDRGAISQEEVSFYENAAVMDYEGTEKALNARTVKPKEDEQKPDTALQLANALIELHFNRGAITEDEKPFYTTCAVRDYEGTSSALSKRPGTDTLNGFMGTMSRTGQSPGAGSDEQSKWTYLDYYKNDLDGLFEMQRKEPEKYNKLFNAHQLSLKQSGKYILDEE